MNDQQSTWHIGHEAIYDYLDRTSARRQWRRSIGMYSAARSVRGRCERHTRCSRVSQLWTPRRCKSI